MTRQQLVDQIFLKKSYLCVGLDTDITKIPKHLLSETDPVFTFNKAIIDATKDLCVSYKINTALLKVNTGSASDKRCLGIFVMSVSNPTQR